MKADHPQHLADEDLNFSNLLISNDTETSLTCNLPFGTFGNETTKAETFV